MNCNECGGELTHIDGLYVFNSKIIGETTVPDIKYQKCSRCDESIISLAESKKVTSYIKQKEQETIKIQPFDLFVSASEAAEMLGYTKQAFSKNPRIKRGLIMFGIKDGRKYYLRDSVKQFKKKKNGLYRLPDPAEPILIQVVNQPIGVFENGRIGQPMHYIRNTLGSYKSFIFSESKTTQMIH